MYLFVNSFLSIFLAFPFLPSSSFVFPLSVSIYFFSLRPPCALQCLCFCVFFFSLFEIFRSERFLAPNAPLPLFSASQTGRNMIGRGNMLSISEASTYPSFHLFLFLPVFLLIHFPVPLLSFLLYFLCYFLPLLFLSLHLSYTAFFYTFLAFVLFFFFFPPFIHSSPALYLHATIVR